jgi:hypothetical protein
MTTTLVFRKDQSYSLGEELFHLEIKAQRKCCLNAYQDKWEDKGRFPAPPDKLPGLQE